MERQAVREAANMVGVVMSIGGGALLDPENRRALEATGVIVLLVCESDTLVARLEESMRRGERPLLGENLRERVETLLEAREAVYSLVRLRVDTTHLAPEEAAERVLALYRQAVREGAIA
jgi:shikimate kinase